MNNNPERNKVHHTIRENISQAIQSGEVKMRPKWHYIVRAALFAVGFVFVLVAVLYIASFIIFSLHETGVWFAPAFGFHGIRVFLFSLPWLLILLAVLFIVLLEILVRHYSFAYRRPLLYSVLGVLGIVVVGGVVIYATSLHERFFENARQGHLPIAGKFYRDFGMQHFRDVHPGMITELTEDGFKMKALSNEILTVIITPETQFPMGTGFAVNDKVLVLGDATTSTIKALGIRTINTIASSSANRYEQPRRMHLSPRMVP